MEYSELQEKGFELARRYESLPLQDRINIIAKSFSCESGTIKTSPCTGKWRGTSDISIVFDSGVSLFVGNYRTPQAKTVKVQSECVNGALAAYHPDIVSEAKARATAALLVREAKDNAVAAQKGLKPFTFLNVEFNDGADDKSSSYLGWYYATLSVDNKVFAIIETGLSHDITRGIVSEDISREKFFIAGALKEKDVDFVFNNVGFASSVGLYQLPLSDEARERANVTLQERQRMQKAPAMEVDQNSTYSIYQLKSGDETRDFRFKSLENLESLRISVGLANYNMVYEAPLTEHDTLDNLFTKFNIDHPPDFWGHSLSVSDVVVLHQNGEATAYYVDSFGFKEIPDFLEQKTPTVYMGSLNEASEKDEIPAFRESQNLNIECARDIEKAINNSRSGEYHYNLRAALDSVMAQFGTERVHIVLANTLDKKSWDGRFSHANKDWGNGIVLPGQTDHHRFQYVCETHPALLDGFIHQVRKAQQDMDKRPSVTDQLKKSNLTTPKKEKEPSRDEGR